MIDGAIEEEWVHIKACDKLPIDSASTSPRCDHPHATYDSAGEVDAMPMPNLVRATGVGGNVDLSIPTCSVRKFEMIVFNW